MPSVYYFSVPCCATKCQKDGKHVPEKGIEPLFVMRSCQIGAYTGKTQGGIIIDERWRKNDGLVNTVSSMSPSGAPFKTFDRDDIQPGIWNILPEIDGDHMWLQGGLIHRHDIRTFYLDLLMLIEKMYT